MRSKACGWTVAGVLAASMTPLASQEAVFRSGVDLVTVDAAVVGPDGHVVSTLSVGDFDLRVDGEPRRLVSAQFVPLDAGAGAPAPVPATHFTTNQSHLDGRLVVVAIDEAHIRRLEGRVAFGAAADFVDRLTPADHVAVTSLRRADVISFTRDRAAARRRLLELAGEGDPFIHQFNIGAMEALEIADGTRSRLADVVLRECGRALTEYLNPARAADDAGGGRDACPEQVEQEARAAAQFARTQARMSLAALEALVASLGRLEGPKTLVLLTEGLVAEPRYIDFGELSAAAQAARVSIYVLQLEAPIFEAAQTRLSPTWQQDILVRGDGLSRLAGASRGAMFRLVGNDPRPFDRIRRELSGHYLLAFEPADSDRDGRLHRIRVSVTRKGATLRAREAFRVPAVRPTVRAREQELVDLLRTTRPARDLPVRVATFTYGEPASANLRVVVSAEADVAPGAGDALLGYVLVDRRGVIASSGANRVASGRYSFSTVVPPGDYMLRVAAIDPLARRGSLERPFAAELTAGAGLRVSDLIVGRGPSAPEDPVDPVVDRLTDREAILYLELYPAGGHVPAGLRVRMEIADGHDTPALVASDAAVSTDGRVVTARALVSLHGLPARPYVARAIVSPGDGGRDIGVARPFVLAAR